LLFSIDQSDEIPNQELANEIISFKDKKAIQELANHPDHQNKVK